MKLYYVYILSNWNGNVIYTGMTADLTKRIYEHKSKAAKGFTEKYNVSKLVYFETAESPGAAINREKQIKSWRREKKNALIATMNPEWKDLYETIC